MFPEGRIVEFLIVAVVALIVVGPKDLPVLMRNVGRFIARMRGMAAEFRASFDDMARQAELDELRREVEALKHAQPLRPMSDEVAHPDVSAVFDEIHASLAAGDAQLHPVMSHQYPTGADAVPPAPEPAQTVVEAPHPTTSTPPSEAGAGSAA